VILNEQELKDWGHRIGEEVEPPIFLGLRGPLGAGKSVLARAIARGAGVVGTLPSPTFNLLFRYGTPSGAAVIHMDLYRLNDPEELWELGWQDLGGTGEFVLVEWPERAGPYLPEDRWDITLSIPPASHRGGAGTALGPGCGGSGRGSGRGGGEVRAVEVCRFGSPPPLPGFPVRVSRP
jgi:tRNA threonylcarbamoyladenosine biosynthesis protein TsaE